MPQRLCNATDFAVNPDSCLTCSQCKGLYHPFCGGDGRDKYKCGKCAVSLLKPGIPQKKFLAQIVDGKFLYNGYYDYECVVKNLF